MDAAFWSASRTPLVGSDRKVRERIEALKLRGRVEGETLKGGFAADVERYLKLAKVRQLATFEQRKRQLEKFVDRFGTRDRLSITKQEVEVAMGEWQEREKWAPATFNKYLTALKHFYNALDDPEGRLLNPVRRIARQTEPEPLPRAIDYDIIHKILDVMCRDDSVPSDVDAEIRRLFAQGMTRKDIAQQVGFSNDTVGKVLKREPAKPGDEESLAKIRLRVIAFTGLRDGQVAKLLPEHYDRDNECVWVTGTKQGHSFWKPLDEEGIAALVGTQRRQNVCRSRQRRKLVAFVESLGDGVHDRARISFWGTHRAARGHLGGESAQVLSLKAVQRR